jgi:beta-N-acetylhexosaminidase
VSHPAAHPRRTATLLACAAAAALVLGLVGVVPARAQSTGPDDHASPHAKAIATMQRMTLREKVGQLFVPYVYGDSATTQDPQAVAQNQALYGVDNAAQLVEKYHPGGIIYYTWSGNLNNPKQIAELSNGIQEAAMSQRVPVPLLVSTDQEQGVVTRIGSPATQFPGNMALGATRSTDAAHTAAAITGRELRAMGINQDFAPVADVNVNPRNPVIGVRSFGSDPQLVADMTAAAVSGYQGAAGIAATAKHFPGHGDTSIDTHEDLATNHHTLAEWKQIDLPPFEAAIDQGIDSIMTAHVLLPAVDDSGVPATLSKPVLTGWLRHRLHFRGVIVTDSLGMGAVRAKWGDDQVPVMALNAGADLLLKPPKMDVAFDAVMDAVRSGEVAKHRLNSAVVRILELKYENGVFADPFVDVSQVDERVGTPQTYQTAQEITDDSVTLLKNEQGLLPVDPDTVGDVLVTGWGVGTTSRLQGAIADRGVSVDRFWTGSPSESTIEAAVAEARQHDLTVVTSGGAWEDPSQQRLVHALEDADVPFVVVAVSDPYDIAYFPGVPAYLATYSYGADSMASAARALFGEISPSGKLPVTIPMADNPDEVLYPFGSGLSYAP